MFAIASSPWGYKKAWKGGFSCARELSWQVMQTPGREQTAAASSLLPRAAPRRTYPMLHLKYFHRPWDSSHERPWGTGSESTSTAGILDMCFLSVTEHCQGSAGPTPISQWQPDLGPAPRDSPHGRGRWPKLGFSKLMPAVSPEVTPAS